MGDWAVRTPAQQFEMIGQDTLVRPVVVYPSTTANTKGPWTQLTGATTIDAYGFSIMVPFVYYGSDYLLDVAFGAAGSEVVVVSNLSVSVGSSYGQSRSFMFRVPLQVPTGTRVTVRCQATGTSPSRYLRCGLLLDSMGGSAGSSIVTIGANTANSGGTPVDPGAADNTKGSWVEVTAATTVDLFGVSLAFGNIVNTSRTTCYWLVDLGIGGAGAEQVIIPDIVVSTDEYPDSLVPEYTPLYQLQIPAGTRLVVRAACTITDATDRLFDVIAYGLA